jgi:putative N-acetyltransferase (TIGR04045 family)
MGEPAPAAVICRTARSSADVARHLAVRRAVFVDEQRIFVGSDRDDRDDDPGTLHILATSQGVPCGAVRLYRIEDGSALARAAGVEGEVWQGDRLAVLAAFRRFNVGSPLVRHAVRTAGELGGSVMVARIQRPNVTFFRRLGWSPTGAADHYAGLQHEVMTIALGGTA